MRSMTEGWTLSGQKAGFREEQAEYKASKRSALPQYVLYRSGDEGERNALPRKYQCYRFTPHYEGFTTHDETFAPHDKGFTPHNKGFTPHVVLWHCVKTL